MQSPHIEVVSGITFYRGRLAGQEVVLAKSGVGKVFAAMCAQTMVLRYGVTRLFVSGVAGSLSKDLHIGDVVIATTCVQHDMDTSGIGDPVGLISTVNRMDFPTARQDEARAALDGMGIAYRVGSVATGDWFATECDRARWIADTFRPLLIEMEGCAAAQVCWRNDVEFLALKSVSDCVLAHHDFYFNFPQAMRDLNKTALPLAERLLEG